MKHYGLEIPEGSKVTNITVDCGTSDPSTPNAGELFFRTDIGSGTLRVHNGTSWQDLSSGGIADLIDDTTPQLGGDLDVNGNEIITAANSTTNFIIRPGTRSSGSDSAVETYIYGGELSGTATTTTPGNVLLLGGHDTRSTGFNRGGNIELTGGQGLTSSTGIGGAIRLYGGNGASDAGNILFQPGRRTDTNAPADVRILPPGSAATTPDLRFYELGSNGVEYVGFKAPDNMDAASTGDGTTTIWTLPEGDGTSGQVMQTDGTGILSWVTRISSVLDDTTPQLGGNLNAGGFNITNGGTITATGHGSTLSNHYFTNSRLEVNYTDTGNRNALVDFHNQDSNDYDARIIKWSPGAAKAGWLEIINESFGDFVLMQNTNAGLLKLTAPNGTNPEIRLDTNSTGSITTYVDGTLKTEVNDQGFWVEGGLSSISTNAPDLRFIQEDAPSTHQQIQMVYDGDNFITKVRTDAGALVANAYLIGVDDDGATGHQFFVGNTIALRVDHLGTIRTQVTDYETIVTDDDDVPNKKYVDDAIANAGQNLNGWEAIEYADLTNGGSNDLSSYDFSHTMVDGFVYRLIVRDVSSSTASRPLVILRNDAGTWLTSTGDYYHSGIVYGTGNSAHIGVAAHYPYWFSGGFTAPGSQYSYSFSVDITGAMDTTKRTTLMGMAVIKNTASANMAHAASNLNTVDGHNGIRVGMLAGTMDSGKAFLYRIKEPS